MTALRTDIIDVYVARGTRGGSGPEFEFLQLLRAKEPMNATWQPVMGHIESGETAVQSAWRETEEEIGLSRDDPRLLGAWALDAVHPFYLATIDAIVMSPQFLVQVVPAFVPRLNHEHTDHRWVRDIADFTWPSQRAGMGRAVELLRGRDSLAAIACRIKQE